MIGSDKFRQLWYDMRHQSVVTSVTLVGTALSVCLLMVVITIQQLNVMSFPPESNRYRIVYGQNIHLIPVETDNSFSSAMGGSSAHMAPQMARRLYGGLDGVEAESNFIATPNTSPLQGPNGKMFEGKVKMADDQFWAVFDHKLLYGRYYDQAEVKSGSHVAVITESVSRRLFDKADGSGETFDIGFTPYTAIGVIADPSPLAIQSYGEVFVPLTVAITDGDPIFGATEMALLLKEGVDTAYIKQQVKARYAELETEMAPTGQKPVYHEGPYSAEVVSKGGYGSNNTPDLEGGRRMRQLTYLVLLLLPAINLGSMLHSRMRRRMGEFGIRRAFGCTRMRIIRDILGENFIVTLLGGAVGWICSIVFLTTFNGMFTNFNNPTDSTPTLTLLLNWRFIGIILLVCFILNLISASIPAWQASRLNVVDAINNRQKS